MTLPITTLATRQLQIEFLFLDLDTCTRCRTTDQTLLEAIERTRPALDAAGVAVSLAKTLVAGEAQARQLGFVSSPTIRINGVDIAGELVESACDTCSEACACDGGVDCRDWIYQGQRSTQPPLGLIVEAIMRHAAGPGRPTPARLEPPVVPDNLRQYFAARPQWPSHQPPTAAPPTSRPAAANPPTRPPAVARGARGHPAGATPGREAS
jgi:hypothetical protein